MGAVGKIDGAERLRHRLRRVEAHRGVGYDDRQDEHAANRLRRRPRNGPLRPAPYSEGNRSRRDLLSDCFLSRLSLHRRWVLARSRTEWEIRGVDDWASLPVLLLLLSIFSFVANPISSAASRHFEHQADQYGLEVTHGLTPNSGEVAAQSFQILGEVDLSDPKPNPLDRVALLQPPAITDASASRSATTHGPTAATVNSSTKSGEGLNVAPRP